MRYKSALYSCILVIVTVDNAHVTGGRSSTSSNTAVETSHPADPTKDVVDINNILTGTKSNNNFDNKVEINNNIDGKKKNRNRTRGVRWW